MDAKEKRDEIRKNFYEELKIRYLEGYDTIELKETVATYKGRNLVDCTFFSSWAYGFYHRELKETPIIEVMKEVQREDKYVNSIRYERLEILKREGLLLEGE